MATSKTTGSERSVHIGRDAIGNTIVTGDKNKIIIYQTIQQVDTEELSVDEIGPNPYLGLGAFQEKDADRFFGREKLTKQLWGKFRDLNEPSVSGEPKIRLLPIIGPSGSGKSSLARAGLIPELARQPLPSLDSARIAVLTPGTHPLEALAGVMARIATNDATPVKKTAEFTEVLNEKNDEQQYKGLQRIANLLPSIESSPLVVLVDQFEEVYSLCEDKDECQVFIKNLLHTASDRSGRVSVILTLRSDFLGETQSNEKLNITIARQGEIVPAMSEVELRDAISKPAANAGHPLDEYTIDQLISQAKGREGALPLLQFALTRIWVGLAEGIEAAETLRDIGGIGGALAGEAQRLYDKLDDDQKNIARRAFMAMIQPGEGTRDTRRRVRVADVIVPREDSERVRQVLNIFCGRAARLITLSSDEAGIQTAEVSHEALLEHWHALNTWLDSSRDDLRFQRRMDEAARHWDHEGRPEGLLWRPPDLDLLVSFHERKQRDMTILQIEFFESSRDSEHKRREAERRRRRLTLAIVGVAAVVFLVLALLARSQRNEAREQRKIAVARELAAQAEFANLTKADLLSRSVLLAVESMRRSPSHSADQALRRGLNLLRRNIARLSHDDYVNAIDFSPDGRHLATASNDKTARVWDVISGHEVSRVKHDAFVRATRFSPNGELMATASEDGTARIWEVASGDEIARFNHKYKLRDLAFSPDGKRLATTSWGHEVVIWQVASGHEVGRVEHDPKSWVNAVAFSSDGKHLATAGSDKSAVIWEVSSGHEIFRLNHEESVQSIKFSPNGKYLATASGDILTHLKPGGHIARVWDSTNGREIARMIHSGSVSAIAFSPNSTKVASVSHDNSARVWEATTGREVAHMDHEAWVESVAFSPDGQYLTTASQDHTARVWEAATGQEVARITDERPMINVAYSPDGRTLATVNIDGVILLSDTKPANPVANMKHEGWVRAISFSHDGKYVASADDKAARVWEVTSGNEVARIDHEGWVRATIFSPDDRYIASASVDKTARVFEADSGKEIARLKHGDAVETVSFSPDGQYLATASQDHTARVWEATTGREVVRLEHEGWVETAVFSPDGRYLATASRTSSRIWDATTWKEVSSFRQHEEKVISLTFSPDGKYLVASEHPRFARVLEVPYAREVARLEHIGIDPIAFSPTGQLLATGSWTNSVKIWQPVSGQEISHIDHIGIVGAVAFSPNGRLMATGSSRNMARIWEVATGREIAHMETGGEVHVVAFSPDGQYLATGSTNGALQVWLLSPDDLINQACACLTRNLSLEEWRQHFSEEPFSKTCPNLPIHTSFIDAAMDITRVNDVQKAIELLQDALKSDHVLKLDPDNDVRRRAAERILQKGKYLASEGDVERGTRWISEAIELDPAIKLGADEEAKKLAAEHWFYQVEWLYSVGRISEALSAYAKTKELRTTYEIPIETELNLCWYGSKHGYAADVMENCERAVASAPTEGLAAMGKNARGLARALTGQYSEAIEDFNVYLSWKKKNDDYDEYCRTVETWIKDLEAGSNPFDKTTLELLE